MAQHTNTNLTDTQAMALDTANLVGDLLDNRYRIDRVLGSGGLGVVYLATHVLMERPVAIKLIHSHLIDKDHATLTRDFHNEAKLTGKVEHPNAITVFDYGVHAGVPYLVMEYLQGRTLKQIVRKETKLAQQRILGLFRQIGAALAKAHSLGIVHRDLKPENIMLIDDGQGGELVKVLDFGIAKLVGVERPEQPASDDEQVVGTPRYMAPEQIRGEHIDSRVDVYALGAILYELLCGSSLFPNEELVSLLYKQAFEKPMDVRNVNPRRPVPDAIAEVTMRALEKQPDARFESVIEFIAACRDAFEGPPAERAHQTGPLAAQRSYSMEELLSIWDSATEFMARGNYIAAYHVLNAVIDDGILDAKLIHLAVLALARAGATGEALDYLSQHAEHLPDTEDYRALRARLLKDRFKQATTDTDRRILVRQARDAYLDIHHATRGAFTGINAATLTLLMGENQAARNLAMEVLAICLKDPMPDYWNIATQAEAHVLLGNEDQARGLLRQAVDLDGGDLSARNSTYQQLRLIRTCQAFDEALLAPIRPPAVMSYARSGDLPVQFGRAAQARLRDEIRTVLDEHNLGIAFGGIGGVAEILVAEIVRERGAAMHILLPAPRDIVYAWLYATLGEEWLGRVNQIMSRAASVTVLDADNPAMPGSDTQLFVQYANGAAMLNASALDAPVMHLRLSSTTGCAQAVPEQTRTTRHCFRTVQITIDTGEAGPATVQAPGEPDSRSPLALVAIAVAGLNDIDGAHRARFVIGWNAGLAERARTVESRAALVETWGASALFVVDAVDPAVELARTLRQAFTRFRGGIKLQDAPHLGLRTVVHQGLMITVHDDAGRPRNVFGAAADAGRSLATTAPSGCVYVTEPVATQLASEAHAYRFEYAGEPAGYNGADALRLYACRKQAV